MVTKLLRGVIVPLITPYDKHDRLDRAGIVALVDFLVERGVHGLFPGGTTGEGPLLNLDERRALAEAVVEAAAERVPVVVHTGAITTADSIALTRHAQAIGAQAAALIPPFYYRYSDQALLDHVCRVAQAVPEFPIYLYNNPGVTGYRLSRAWVEQVLACCPNVVGIKDSSGDLELLGPGLAWRDGHFNTAGGSDALFLAVLALGVDACVSGNANVVPELTVALYRAMEAGDLATARTLQQRLDRVRLLLGDGRDLSLFKGILARRGIPVSPRVRPPLSTVSAEVIDRCWQALQTLDLGFV